MKNETVDFYPVVIVEDRYQGTYSGAKWIATANADQPLGCTVRAHWILDNGPNGSDLEAANFWASAPSWVAAGGTPDQAKMNLFEANSCKDPD